MAELWPRGKGGCATAVGSAQRGPPAAGAPLALESSSDGRLNSFVFFFWGVLQFPGASGVLFPVSAAWVRGQAEVTRGSFLLIFQFAWPWPKPS